VIKQLPHLLNTRTLLFLPFVEDPNALFLGTFHSMCYWCLLVVLLTLLILFAEIMDNNIDIKKLCARVGGRRDLAANLQSAKKKKDNSTDTTSTQNNLSNTSSGRVVDGLRLLSSRFPYTLELQSLMLLLHQELSPLRWSPRWSTWRALPRVVQALPTVELSNPFKPSISQPSSTWLPPLNLLSRAPIHGVPDRL